MEEAMKANEAKQAKPSDKKGRKKTDRQRWYALWDELFPGKARPTEPYKGTEVDLIGALATEYMKRPNGGVLSAEAQTAVMGYVDYARDRLPGTQRGDVPGQGVSDSGKHQTQEVEVQDQTHQHLPLSTNSSGPAMGSLEQPDARHVAAGLCFVPTLDATIAPQVLSNFEPIGQHLAPAANWAVAHAVPPNPWMNIGFGNGHVDLMGVPFPPTGAVLQDWMGGCQHVGQDGTWDFADFGEWVYPVQVGGWEGDVVAGFCDARGRGEGSERAQVD